MFIYTNHDLDNFDIQLSTAALTNQELNANPRFLAGEIHNIIYEPKENIPPKTVLKEMAFGFRNTATPVSMYTSPKLDTNNKTDGSTNFSINARAETTGVLTGDSSFFSSFFRVAPNSEITDFMYRLDY